MPDLRDLAFKDSDLIDVYLEELYWLSSSIKNNTEKIFQMAKVPEKGYLIQVDPEIHSLIKSVIDESTQVKNLLKPRAHIGDESDDEYRYRKERGEQLSGLFRDIDLTEILRDDVRNSMEHFDERLDKLSFTVRKNIRKKDQFIAYNMVFSEKTVMTPFPNPIRIYVSKEKSFYIFGLKLDIWKIHEESKRILEVLNTDPRRKKISEPGGMLLPIKARID